MKSVLDLHNEYVQDATPAAIKYWLSMAQQHIGPVQLDARQFVLLCRKALKVEK